MQHSTFSAGLAKAQAKADAKGKPMVLSFNRISGRAYVEALHTFSIRRQERIKAGITGEYLVQPSGG